MNGPDFWAQTLLPPTCCDDEKLNCSTDTGAYRTGCSNKVASAVEGMGTTVGLILFGIAFFEVGN